MSRSATRKAPPWWVTVPQPVGRARRFIIAAWTEAEARRIAERFLRSKGWDHRGFTVKRVGR